MDAITIAIIIIASLLVIIGIVYLVKKFNSKESISGAFSSQTCDIKLKDQYLNNEEFYFYNFVREHLDPEYYILPKVGVDNILEPQNNNLKQYNSIKQKYIDFIVFDVATQKPLFAIDLVEHPMSVRGSNPYFDKDISLALQLVKIPICTKIVDKYYILDVLKQELYKYIPAEVEKQKEEEAKKEQESESKEENKNN